MTTSALQAKLSEISAAQPNSPWSSLEAAVEVLKAVIEVEGGAGPVTQQGVAVAASTAGTIPAGAKGWSITFLTGTGTWLGVAVPAGFSDSSESSPVAALAYITDAASTAFVRYGS